MWLLLLVATEGSLQTNSSAAEFSFIPPDETGLTAETRLQDASAAVLFTLQVTNAILVVYISD
jgi:hypothetical protein